MFDKIRRKIAAKLSFLIILVVTFISVVFTLYFSQINKKNLTEYIDISLSNAIHFAQMGYAQSIWDYNESEISNLSQIILKNRLIIAVNVFDNDAFLMCNIKRASYKETLYEVIRMKTPYQIPLDQKNIKIKSGEIVLKNKAVGKFELFYTEEFLNNAVSESNTRMIFAFIITAVLITAVLMFGADRINRPILELARIAVKIADNNDFSIQIKRSDRIDEVGILVNGFANMIEQIRQKEMEKNSIYDTLEKNLIRFNALFAALQKAIDTSDYSMRINLESENDELAVSLNKVMQTLEAADLEKKNQNWLKNGQTELGSIISRERDIVRLAKKAIEFIAFYVDAKVGTLFVKDESRNDFKMAASYAFRTRKGVSNRFKVGEGLTGQAALEKKIIIFTDVPDDYIAIDSSLGSAVPKNIIVLPIVYEDDVKGVIELGSIAKFSPIQLTFLEVISEVVAIAIHGAIFNEKLSLLLERTREQAEELQTQQEELRASNEELEEKTEMLSAQKHEIEKSNEILKAKQKEIEDKAAQIKLETQYKSEFLANMSHELRTPLNSLLLLANMLAENEEKNLTPDQIESASSIYRSGQNLLHLINNILDISKIEAKKIDINISECSLNEIASHFKSEFMHMADAKGISFNVITGDNLPDFITTDIYRLEQIVRNLIGNAIKFTDSGSVTLSFKNAGSQKISISVADTGIGIPPDKINTVFEAFKQVDGSIRRKHDGTGLGLSISKELAHLLGGKISVQSEPEKGSTFTLNIPVHLKSVKRYGSSDGKRDAADDKSNSAVKSTVSDNNLNSVKSKSELSLLNNIETPNEESTFSQSDEGLKTMLIIEDDPEFANILSNFFKKHGYRAVVAPTGEDGIKYVIDTKPAAIILDIALPGIDGWAVMHELKSNPETRHIPVHIMSGHDYSLKGLEKGAVGYLTKPVSISDLEKALQKIEIVLSSDVKHLLVVEDNSDLQLTILKLIGTNDIIVTAAVTGEEAISLLKERHFDCMILDLGLPDISGFEVIERISKDPQIEMLPVIVFTARELTSEEAQTLEEYASSIVLKNAVSMERLIDETALFLHRVESQMPERQKQMIKKVRDQQTFLKDKKVLVVDDDMRNAFALNKFLKSKEMEVVIANNGHKALQILEDGDIPDIILMDIMMPVMDGYDAMQRIRENSKFDSIPIIALTAKAMSSDRDECIRCGANDYLSKPLDTAKLLTLLRVWLYR